MEQFVSFFLDFILHLDQNLPAFLAAYGSIVYVVLFLIIFCETGLVVTPFLPGDSIIFVCGTMAVAGGGLNLAILFPLLIAAAVGGDALNYLIGHKLGQNLLNRGSRLIKSKHIDKAEQFYAKHGKKAIFLARFVPIVRTFAPFVAGIGRMHYGAFAAYNVSGGIFWVSFFLLTGYFFGNMPVVQDNFSLIIVAIIIISFLPVLIEVIKEKKRQKKTDLPPA